ncbi:ABC transporter ATP-binding protein [Microlunatus sp. Y2014]|uniref:ABC transporter ATP-binding protein n=1 Tax=Microlunatus sp. Y2014 TaxID=3418488 RepID=UPI003DA77E89
MITFPVATPREVRRTMRDLFRGRLAALVVAGVVLAAAAAAGLVMPNAMGRIVDVVGSHAGGASDAGMAEVLTLAGVMVGGVLAAAGLTAIGTVLAVTAVETAVARLRERLVSHLLRLPVGTVADAGSGDAVSRATDDVAEVSGAVNEVLPAVSGALFTIVLTFVGLAAIDWRFGVALALVLPIQFMAVRFLLKHAPAQYAGERAAMADRAGAVLSSLRGVDAVHAHRLEPQRRRLISTHSWQVVHWSMRQQLINNRFWGRLNLAEYVGMSALVVTGFWLVQTGEATTGMTTATVLLFHRLFGPIGQLLLVVDTWQSAAASLRRIVGVLSVPVTPGDATVPDTITTGTVDVTDVTFAYGPGRRPTLDRVSLHVPAGRSLAVVGASGAGKSTLAAVIAGLRPTEAETAGRITVDGVDLAGLDPRTRSRVVGLVTQETHVFAATVRENLTLAAPDADDDLLWATLSRVGADGWVASLPDGLDEVLGAHGITPTGSRAQQLALARLDLLDPPVVILDEATAEAGSSSAAQLDEAARTVTAGRTTIMIAHRLDQASTADEIAYVAHGRIVEHGPHQALLAAGGPYADLWTAWRRGRESVHDTATTA